MKKFKNQNAITLIALVITIVVLLILAGVALSLVVGEDGITNRAITAAKTQDIAGAKEKLELLAASYAGDFYEAKYITGAPEATSLGDYVASKFTPGTFEENFTLTIDANDSRKITISSKNYADNFATCTINDDGEVVWEGVSGGDNLTIPSDLQIGSTITWTPSGSYVWDKDLYASDVSDDYPNVYLASGDKATTENINTRKAELTAKTDKTAEEIKELDALNNSKTMTMTISTWKVLSKTDNEVVIVPDEPTAQEPKLQGAQGYNNAVKLLNDACSSLYGSENGVTARSVKIEDIENAVKEVGNESILTTKQGANYNNYPYGAYNSSKSYPAIWAEELGAEIDGMPKNGTLGLSSQSSFFTNRNQNSSNNIVGGVTAGTSIRVKQTYYYSALSDLFKVNDSDSDEIKNKKAKYLDIFNTSDDYWVASRCVVTDSSSCDFSVRHVRDGYLDDYYLFSSDDDASGTVYGFLPVVSLSSGVLSGSDATGFTFTTE